MGLIGCKMFPVDFLGRSPATLQIVWGFSRGWCCRKKAFFRMSCIRRSRCSNDQLYRPHVGELRRQKPHSSTKRVEADEDNYFVDC
jgi:hypothetical protein